MREQDPENHDERNYWKTVGYPEKNRIQERKVFQEGYTPQKNSRVEQLLLTTKLTNKDLCLVGISEVVEGGSQMEEKKREI